jgi:putative aminopeptidase FrvX
MKIVISAHFDLAKPVKYLHLDSNNLNGLVDNFAGVFVSYQASRKTNVELYLTNFEEKDLGGAVKVVKDLKGQDVLVIVVDTCTDAQNKKGYVGNAYGIDTQKMKKKFSKDILFKDGYFEPTEDETAIYGQDFNFPCFYFGVPINGNYHDTNNKVALKTIDEATKTLINLIKWLKKNHSKVLL